MWNAIIYFLSFKKLLAFSILSFLAISCNFDQLHLIAGFFGVVWAFVGFRSSILCLIINVNGHYLSKNKKKMSMDVNSYLALVACVCMCNSLILFFFTHFYIIFYLYLTSLLNQISPNLNLIFAAILFPKIKSRMP